MKRNFIILLFIPFLIFSCERTTNYSVQVDKQKKDIKEYIKNNDIELIYDYPSDSVFGDNQYYWMNEDSIVFNLRSKGVGKSVEVGDILQVRWVQYDLKTNDSISYWDVSDMPKPLEILYDPKYIKDMNTSEGYSSSAIRTNTNCIGWQTAIRLMNRSGAVADFIVPSPIGLKDAFSEVKAYRYKFTFKILPK